MMYFTLTWPNTVTCAFSNPVHACNSRVWLTTRYFSPEVVTLQKDGVLVGPFGAQLHTPRVGQHFLGMSKAISQVPGLSPRNREIAIITTGARFNAAYELYAHKVLGRMKGISEEEIEEMLRGKRPETFDEEGKAVYDAAHELVDGSGPLSQAAWDRLVKLLSKDGATALVQLVGFYSYVCMILRGFDCKIPDADK
jgi:4-carboxymuconolactone decarboxylase